jgi:hypothetical protein
MKLHDSSIAQIAKLIQMALLTGTDIVDHLRTITFVNEDGELRVDPEYLDNFNKNLEKMISELPQSTEATENDTDAHQLPLF